MPTPLETQVDLLIAWCEANTADNLDLCAALAACAVRLRRRTSLAKQDEVVAAKVERASKLASAGKTPMMVEPEPEPAGPGRPNTGILPLPSLEDE